MKKRMLTMLLALVMILSALPFSAMAAEECAHSKTYLEKTESTCVTKGVIYCFCKDCGARRWAQVQELVPHSYGADSKCKVCGIVCTKHTYGAEVTDPATCTEPGSVTKTCTICGAEKLVKIIKATEHKFTVEVIGLAATCTVDGYTTHKTCSVCGEKNDAYTVIKAKGHKLVTDKDVAATCTKSGTLEQHCENEKCEYTYKETRKNLGHNYVPATGVAPTCTEEGFEDYEQCTRCGKQRNVTSIAATGHTYVNGQCKDCGAAAPDYTGPSKPNSKCQHTSKSTYTTSPDCEDVGYIVVTCDECHAEMSREIIPAIGHMSKVVIKDATCTEDGYEREICGFCRDTISNTIFAKLGHNYVNGICTRCGGSDSSKYTNDFQEVQIVGGTAY